MFARVRYCCFNYTTIVTVHIFVFRDIYHTLIIKCIVCSHRYYYYTQGYSHSYIPSLLPFNFLRYFSMRTIDFLSQHRAKTALLYIHT